MAILYPPTMDDILPAFYANTKEMGKKGFFMDVPISFTLNRLVAPNEVKSIIVRYKELDDTKIGESSYTFNQKEMQNGASYELRLSYNKTEMDNNIKTFKLGQYYKIQIACLPYDWKNNDTLYWSTDSIFKYMGYAEVELPGLEKNVVNQFWDSIEGKFTHEQDPTETEYAYRFWIQDKKNKIVKESSWQYYNGQTDIFRFYEELKNNEVYYLYYQVQTINNQIFTTRGYPIKQSYDIPIQGQEKYWQLVAEPDQENGRIIVNLKYTQSSSQNDFVDGNFRVVKYNGRNWFEIERFKIEMSTPVSLSFIDDVIENEGVYMYALQEFNADKKTGKIKVISERFAISNVVKIHLEHMFLSDKDRVLKIKYNPKVSSYKINVLEQKQETIGSKYPFFFRNPIVGYREFNLSGLISYLADEDQMFMYFGQRVEAQRPSTPSILPDNGGTGTDLTANNIFNEQVFREEVLNWLNDGQIKLLRSPTEGTFLVRCMNTSLSPEDTLGRMLYTFNTTATEAMEVNYSNLDSLGFYHKLGEEVRGDGVFVFWRSTNWQDILENGLGKSLLPPSADGIKYRTIRRLRIQDFEFGDKFTITLNNSQYDIIINKTGNYFIDYPIKDIVYNGNIYQNSRNNLKTGIIAFEIEAYTHQIFKWIEEVKVNSIPYTQIIGSAVEPDENDDTYSYNLLDGLNNLKYTARIRYMRFYVDDYLTRFGFWQSGRTFNGQNINTKIKIQIENDIREIDVATVNQNLIIKENSAFLTLSEVMHYFEINDLKDIELLEIGNGVTAELSFYVTEMTYTPEVDNKGFTYFSYLQDMLNQFTNILRLLPKTTRQTRKELLNKNKTDKWTYQDTDGATVDATGLGLKQYFNWFSTLTRSSDLVDDNGKFKLDLLYDNFHTHTKSSYPDFFKGSFEKKGKIYNYELYTTDVTKGSYTIDLLQYLWEHNSEWQNNKYQIASRYIKDLYLQLYKLWYAFDVNDDAANVFRCQNAVKSFIRYIRNLYLEYLDYSLYKINEDRGGV